MCKSDQHRPDGPRGDGGTEEEAQGGLISSKGHRHCWLLPQDQHEQQGGGGGGGEAKWIGRDLLPA